MVGFGQRVDLIDIIKRTIHDYPIQSILCELVQNADDARATEVHVVFDKRNHARDSLWAPSMEQLQGPWLLVFNNKEFSPKDMENITKVASGSKEHNVGMTGKFGLGFLSVYNLTDCPEFITGNSLCIFDPLCEYVPGTSTLEPGVKCPLEPSHVVGFKDQFVPFDLPWFNCTPGNKFSGTIFRFPFRQYSSKIANKVLSERDIMDMLKALQQKDILLFLRSVRKITVSEISREGALSIYNMELK